MRAHLAIRERTPVSLQTSPFRFAKLPAPAGRRRRICCSLSFAAFEGVLGDLVAVAGNPMEDFTATCEIAAVWKNGFPVEL